jgi:hypothetical protein
MPATKKQVQENRGRNVSALGLHPKIETRKLGTIFIEWENRVGKQGQPEGKQKENRVSLNAVDILSSTSADGWPARAEVARLAARPQVLALLLFSSAPLR